MSTKYATQYASFDVNQLFQLELRDYSIFTKSASNSTNSSILLSRTGQILSKKTASNIYNIYQQMMPQ